MPNSNEGFYVLFLLYLDVRELQFHTLWKWFKVSLGTSAFVYEQKRYIRGDRIRKQMEKSDWNVIELG